MGKVKVRLSLDLILELLHLGAGNILCNAEFKENQLELTFINSNIPDGLHEGHIQSHYVTSELILTKRIV